jgi:Ca2+/Na+ antiporter
MAGLTTLGVIHTAISLIAVAAGFIALIRDKEISPRNRVGQVYVIMTVLTCLTGFGIFQHDGFGKPHVLGIVTLVVLVVAAVAGYTRLYGRASPYVETVSYSMTFFFHWIPAIAETTTRLPLGAPLLPNADAPELQAVTGALFVVFLIGTTLQVRRLHARLRQMAT